MGEVLGVAAGGIGIFAIALHGTRLLLRDIENISEAPKAIADLKDDIRETEMAIKGLEAVKTSDLESLGVAEQSFSAIETCSKACDTFRNDLQRWTRHSENGRLSRWDRFNVGFFQEQKIKSLSKQLLNCKITLISAASIANLHSSIHHTGMTKEIQEKMTASEVAIATAIKSRDIDITEIENRFEAVSLADPGQDNVEVMERDGALKQIEKERKALSESRELLAALLAETENRSGISITNIRMSGDGKVNAGLINTEGKYVNARVNIDNVEAATGGKGIVGIAEGVSLDNFWS